MGETTAQQQQEQEQLELVPALAAARRRAAEATARTTARDRAPGGVDAAPSLPVARVLVDVPLAHLDRAFDYLVPASLHDQVVPGSRVKVRFAGQDVQGFVLERVAESGHTGRLTAVRRSVSPEVVLTPEVAWLCEAVAERYAGTRADVLRLALPPRNATVEKQLTPDPAGAPEAATAASAARRVWERYGAVGVIGDLAAGRAPRVVWTALPGADWAAGLASAAAVALAAGRGVVLCAPDRRDVDRLSAALEAAVGPGRHVVLTADLGPAARYRAFLAVARGAVKAVVGTRSAAFAPVRDLGLVGMWDDGDDLYAEPRAPYPHTREVLLLRAHHARCAAVLAAHARSVEASALVSSGWAREVVASREVVRGRAPRVSVTGATEWELSRDPGARSARLPTSAHEAIREGLARGPVLVQTPRAGYAASLACGRCREPARCRRCSGPLHQPSRSAAPSCRWCGTPEPGWRCAACGGDELRAPVVGDRRTAEELGRAFPGFPVRRSGGERVLAAVEDQPVVVVATPGAEPVADGGYAAVVLLDCWLPLARADLRSAEEAVRRWFNAAALARPATLGGRVVAVGDTAHPALQALVRWDPAGFAAREAEERRSAHLPPASRLAVLSGPTEDLAAAVGMLELPRGAELLGPVPLPPDPAGDETPRARAVVRVPRRSGAVLARALRTVQGVRSARKLPAVRVQVDPWALE